MVEGGVKQGKVIMVSSVLGLFGLIGYGSYVPTKYALRGNFDDNWALIYNGLVGFAETLRQELLAHDIDVHLALPGTIFTPGFEEEQKRKPEITKTIEGADEGQPPEAIATSILNGSWQSLSSAFII